MRAAKAFVDDLRAKGFLEHIGELRVQLYGSLALTGLGHGTDKAIVMGLAGESPETVDPVNIGEFVSRAEQLGTLIVAGRESPFSFDEDFQLHPSELLPRHSNGMRFTAWDETSQPVHDAIYYSVGGGFVVDGEGQPLNKIEPAFPLPYPFQSAAELLAHTRATGTAISQIELCNERSFRDDEETYSRLDAVWRTMQECVQNGCREKSADSEYLPGKLHVRRRAPQLYQKLVDGAAKNGEDPLSPLDWVDVFALAVSEENAAGGRVVTAPTNGAAGIIPAVLHYYHRFVEGASSQGVRNFLLTAGAIGILYKQNASISGAEVGCQGEVGAACSMAAAGLTEVLGGTPEQVEQAAEIAMEHHLGLTCDPVGGLVQIPCIERNAMAATHAIHASRLALRGDGKHCVSLDKVIETMRQTGADMLTKYKETSQGGLAVNVIEC
jgi:L-serine dehydratase